MADTEAEYLEQEVNAQRDVWQVRDSFNFHAHVGSGQTRDDLVAALTNNRKRLEGLKEKYALAVKADGGIDVKPASRLRRVLLKELHGLYSAIEGIKAGLRTQGADFEINEFDEEHPNAAYKRLKAANCYVVSTIYGPRSRELILAKASCRTRFVLNPLVTPSWCLYKLIGPHLAHLSSRSNWHRQIVEAAVALPIFRATDPSLMRALPWLLYLAIPGWAALVLTGTAAVLIVAVASP